MHNRFMRRSFNTNNVIIIHIHPFMFQHMISFSSILSCHCSVNAVTLSMEDSESFFAGHSPQTTFNYSLSNHGPPGIGTMMYNKLPTLLSYNTRSFFLLSILCIFSHLFLITYLCRRCCTIRHRSYHDQRRDNYLLLSYCVIVPSSSRCRDWRSHDTFEWKSCVL